MPRASFSDRVLTWLDCLVVCLNNGLTLRLNERDDYLKNKANNNKKVKQLSQISDKANAATTNITITVVSATTTSMQKQQQH